MATEKPFDDKLSIPELEEKVAEFWDADKTFERSLEKTKNDPPYTFYDGPPFATGLPHYGHILASTIKDLIPRYQTMQGHFVRRRWGWDCHGLPIEEIVERKLGISGKKQIEEVGVQKFNETCRETVLMFADEWRKMVRRMGRWVDFDNSYKTMDNTFMESVWWGFKSIYDKGLVYEGRKVLMYCPRCETPLSNFEVAMDNSYKDIQEESVFIKFPAKDQGLNTKNSVFLLAWTTTPWTLPGNVALAVGKDIDYVRVKVGEEELILAKSRLDVLKAEYEIISEMKGSDLVGTAYEPLFNVAAVRDTDKQGKAFKVYAADFVTTEDGTGIVHTAVVYGEDDYQLGLREGLPVVPLLDSKGNFNENAPEALRGQYFKDAEKGIKRDLEDRSLLFRRENHLHSYPHCWRCGTALFYNALPAWFVNVQKLKPGLLETNDKEMNWYPAHLKHGRYQKTLESAPDWNISRNRYWGNPIPVWKCEECKENTVAGGVEDIRKRSIKKNEFLFVRHGESQHNIEGYCGPQDLPEYTSHLTEKGKTNAEEVGRQLKGKKIDLILSSPLARMRETVELIRKNVDAPVEFCEELRELNVGGLRKFAEWEKIKAEDADPLNTSFPDGESHNDVKARLAKFIREVNEKYSGKTILIATHGGPLWMLEGLLQGLSDEELLKAPYPETGKLFEFDWAPVPVNDRGEVDFHMPYIDSIILKCDKCGQPARRVPEIFDSWIEAGSMPFAEYHYPFENKELFESRFPGQFVAEYIPQTRAWFQLMHVINYALFGKAPVQNLLTTGTILAEDGTKMSKSKNNYPDPWLLIDRYGVDTLRFYLMGSTVMQAENFDFSEKDLGNLHRKVTLILWNVYQYFMTYATEAKSGLTTNYQLPTTNSSHVLDKWIRARTKELITEVTGHLDAYDTVRAARVIEKFVDDLSTWYLRRSRGREDAGFFPAFYETLIATSKIIAPFMPHLAEVIYSNLTHSFCADDSMHTSVHLTSWPEKQDLANDEQELLKKMALVREAASLGLGARKTANIPVRQPLASMSVEISEPLDLEDDLKNILCEEVNVRSATILKLAEGSPVARLDTNLTPELKLEGLTRGLERFVQGLRKEQGFKVGEMAVLHYETADPEIEKAFEQFDIKKTYITKIEKGSGESDFEGKAKISIERA